MPDIAVIGAGAAGLTAGALAAQEGARVEIIDRNERAGRKLYLTGKGRCNITNSADLDGFLKNTVHGGRFLYSAFDGFFSNDILDILAREGVPVKLERGGRYFPES
ncbi:MAG: NAD(P)/FAD-dependent oxidoreductase, partial [Clostridia bacterium]|nr:NAD(P)/FAD-dependent oxidoreductase [Clostridia bacterium]